MTRVRTVNKHKRRNRIKRAPLKIHCWGDGSGMYNFMATRDYRDVNGKPMLIHVNKSYRNHRIYYGNGA